MALTDHQIQLALRIDKHVQRIVDNGGGNEELLTSIFDHMPTFKELMDTTAQGEMDTLCQRYDGFYRYARLLEELAEAIADGRVVVPR